MILCPPCFTGIDNSVLDIIASGRNFLMTFTSAQLLELSLVGRWIFFFLFIYFFFEILASIYGLGPYCPLPLGPYGPGPFII